MVSVATGKISSMQGSSCPNKMRSLRLLEERSDSVMSQEIFDVLFTPHHIFLDIPCIFTKSKDMHYRYKKETVTNKINISNSSLNSHLLI